MYEYLRSIDLSRSAAGNMLPRVAIRQRDLVDRNPNIGKNFTLKIGVMVNKAKGLNSQFVPEIAINVPPNWFSV